MKKYLDILLFTALFFFVFSFFSKGTQEVNKSGIYFSTVKTEYTVPAGVIVSIENYGSGVLDFESCEALELRKNGESIMLPEDSCQRVTLSEKASKTLDFSAYYELFEDPGNYTFTLSVEGKQLISQFEVKYRGFFGKLFVGLFYAPIYNLMVFFIDLFGNSLGMAIIAITLCIRILLLFPQHKMLVSQRKMQAIQPKIKEIQEKHKGNQQLIGMELMKLYKEEWANPMGSCGFLFIQFPILLVMYNVISHITSLKNEFYLYSAFQDFHISQINFNFFGLDLLSSKWIIGIVFGVSIGILQFLQVKLSMMHHHKKHEKKWEIVLEKKQWDSAYSALGIDPEMMNKMMLYFIPGMVAIFTYSLPFGIWLYWGIGTIFAIWQQLFVNKIIKSK